MNRTAILIALQGGESQNAVARRLGCGVATVNRVARSEGLEYSAPTKANEARRDWAAAERLALLNRLFDAAERLLDGVANPRSLQSLALAVAVLIDKRRLEDGLVTSRTEVAETAREALLGRIDELSERRSRRAS